MRKKKTAFTLVELLITTVIMGVISLAIYSVFSNGTKIYKHIKNKETREDVNILFDKFNRDLHNSFKFEGIDFIGGPSSLKFACLVNSRKFDSHINVGQITYTYDSLSGELRMQAQDYSDLYKNSLSGRENVVLSGISAFKFSYYRYDAETKEYSWVEKWAEQELPLAVRMDLELKKVNDNDKFTKTVTIFISRQKK
ncbi:prepilin-type N-terminal cleavage/methylation domain-containing protein, partial [bacterium]